MRDADLWYPYDNEPEPETHTVLVEMKVWSYVDVEAYGLDDLKDNIHALSKEKLINGINDYEIEKAEFENYEEIFDYSEERLLRRKIKELEKEIKKLKGE